MMRAIVLSLVFLLYVSVSFAQQAIILSPMDGDNSLDIVASKIITGKCGKTIVRITGVLNINDKFFTVDSDAAKIIIRNGPSKDMVIQDGSGVLSDYNGVACVKNGSDTKILIWSDCGGSACGTGYSFFVIDPNKLTYVAPKDPTREMCDEKCASKYVGQNIPKKINEY